MTAANLQVDSPTSVDSALQKCHVCDKEIGDAPRFCRILRQEKPAVVLCSPRCALRYFDTLRPAPNGDESDRAACERSFHFVMDGEMP
jgi:hypothetical protein